MHTYNTTLNCFIMCLRSVVVLYDVRCFLLRTDQQFVTLTYNSFCIAELLECSMPYLEEATSLYVKSEPLKLSYMLLCQFPILIM